MWRLGMMVWRLPCERAWHRIADCTARLPDLGCQRSKVATAVMESWHGNGGRMDHNFRRCDALYTFDSPMNDYFRFSFSLHNMYYQFSR